MSCFFCPCPIPRPYPGRNNVAWLNGGGKPHLQVALTIVTVVRFVYKKISAMRHGRLTAKYHLP